MASIEKRGKSYRIIFRFQGQRYTRSLHTRSEKTALGALHRLEDNLRRTELGTLTVPESVDPAEFLLSDGKVTEPAKVERIVSSSNRQHRPHWLYAERWVASSVGSL